MDDTKIREEFDKWIRKDISFEDERFMKENESKGHVMPSCSFFAGYRLAEKQTLENIISQIADKNLSKVQIIAKIGCMLYELKQAKISR